MAFIKILQVTKSTETQIKLCISGSGQLCNLESKTLMVKEDRQTILSELFNHQVLFTFGSLTDDQRESIYSTKNDAIIHDSSEMIAKYATLSELENKEYQKVLSRFKIK